MYRHHEESLKIMEDYFRNRQEVIALIFGGSVAKGTERPDSDLDAMVIVPDDYYEKLLAENRTAETIDGLCTYEGGYFDVKYMTKDYLRAAAEKEANPPGIPSSNPAFCFPMIRRSSPWLRPSLFFRRRRWRRRCFPSTAICS